MIQMKIAMVMRNRIYRLDGMIDGIIKEIENIEKMRVFKQVRNLLAAVGSDDEDEDFGALFSQLARLILKAHILKKNTLRLARTFTVCSMREQSSNLQGEDRKAYAEQVHFYSLEVFTKHINLLRWLLLFTKPLVVAATTRTKTQFSKITMTNDHCDTVFLLIFLDSLNIVFAQF